jgi:hypothetical protein
MSELIPSFERETGQVVLEGFAAGAAGEAPLIPLPGLDLAFDRVDGHLCRAIVDVAGPDGSVAVDEQIAAMLIQLFGGKAPKVVLSAAISSGEAATGKRVLSPEPGVVEALSKLARLDAARITSPIAASPWWAAEAAEIAQRAGLFARAGAEAAGGAVTWRSGPRPGTRPRHLDLNVAAEVDLLRQDRLAGVQWMLDPGLVPAGQFQFGLSPYSDLVVRRESADGPLIVEAVLSPGVDCDTVGGCQARLVDPAVRRTLTQAGFAKTQSRVRAELQPPFPLDDLPEVWIEAVQDRWRPIRSAKGLRVRRALRWADAALRAERAPVGLAPGSTHEDWAELAAAAWGRCSRDWAAAGDPDRACLAARRQAAATRGACVPRPPAGLAADNAGRAPADPAYLAEVLGR